MNKTSLFKRVFSLVIIISLFIQQSGFAQFAAELDISKHLFQSHNSLSIDKFRPLHLRYLSYDAVNNSFNLLIDKGNLKNPNSSEIESASKELLKYFLIGLTLPNDCFRVNLRPDSPDNIIDSSLAQTDIGKIMLESDLQLKKDTALLTSPNTPEGKQYWDKLYKKAREIFGSDNITIPTLTRPWIVPDEIIIQQGQDSAYIYKATLKVMLEEDYLKSSQLSAVSSQQYEFKDPRAKELNVYSTELIRELIIPKLTKEVNTSKRYAKLRQVYYSLILAQGFKQKARITEKEKNNYIKLINSGDLTGLTSEISWSKDTYYREYQKSFRDGEYNLKEPVNSASGQVIRSYFSGGEVLNINNTSSSIAIFSGARNRFVDWLGRSFLVGVTLAAVSGTGINYANALATRPFSIERSQPVEVESSRNEALNLIPEKLINGYLAGSEAGREKFEGFLDSIPRNNRIHTFSQGGKDSHTVLITYSVGGEFSDFAELIAQLASTRDQKNQKKYNVYAFLYNEEADVEQLIKRLCDEYKRLGLDKLERVIEVANTYSYHPVFLRAESKNPEMFKGIVLIPFVHGEAGGTLAIIESVGNLPLDLNQIDPRGVKDISNQYGFKNPLVFMPLISLFAIIYLALCFKNMSIDEERENVNKEKEESSSEGDTSNSSPMTAMPANDTVGGIDFRLSSSVIVTNAITNLSSKINMNKFVLNRLGDMNLDAEWNYIDNMVSSGIIPSSERIKEYIQACCYKGGLYKDIDKVSSCISYILRFEEEECFPTDPMLRDILVVLESAGSIQKLKDIFI